MNRAHIGLIALAAASGMGAAGAGFSMPRFSGGNGFMPKRGGGKGGKKCRRRHPQGRRRNR